jgi:hypothetical protein
MATLDSLASPPVPGPAPRRVRAGYRHWITTLLLTAATFPLFMLSGSLVSASLNTIKSVTHGNVSPYSHDFLVALIPGLTLAIICIALICFALGALWVIKVRPFLLCRHGIQVHGMIVERIENKDDTGEPLFPYEITYRYTDPRSSKELTRKYPVKHALWVHASPSQSITVLLDPAKPHRSVPLEYSGFQLL